MNQPPNEDIPPHGRVIAAVMLVLGAFALLANHWMAASQSAVSLGLLCFGPMLVLLGLGGVVEPKIVWSVGKYGTHLPFKYKLIGGCLAAAGVIVTLLLVFFVYPLGGPA